MPIARGCKKRGTVPYSLKLPLSFCSSPTDSMNFIRACIWLPICLFVFRLVAYYADPLLHIEKHVQSEYGIYENLTFVFLLLAVVLIANTTTVLRQNALLLKKTILLSFALGCIYFAGEEISWGQHFFKWQTPEAWDEINKQGETNIHNTYAIFDYFPREILIASLVFYCSFLPMISFFPAMRNGFWEKHFAWLYPEPRLALVAGLMLLTRLPDRLVKEFPNIGTIPYPINPKEFQELFISLTLFLIAWGVLRNSKTMPYRWNPEKPGLSSLVCYIAILAPLFLISMRPISMLVFALITVAFVSVQYFSKKSGSQSPTEQVN